MQAVRVVTAVEHEADTAADMLAVVHAAALAAVMQAADLVVAILVAAALAAVTRVVAADTAAADIGKFCGFSQKRPVCFGRRAFFVGL
jgi:hypothetical protein